MMMNGEVSHGDVQLGTLTEPSKKSESANEKAKLVEDPPHLSAALAEKYRKAALVVSWLTIIILLILGILTFVVGIVENSAASFAFALDATLDCLTSAVVVWRYIGSAYTVYSDKRERRACIVLGILFLVSALSITIKSVVALAQKSNPSKSSIIWNVALVNVIACTALAISKFYLGRKLDSRSLITDAFSSSAGALISLSVIISDLVYRSNGRVWYLDSLFGLFCAVFLFAYGAKLLYDHVIVPRRQEPYSVQS